MSFRVAVREISIREDIVEQGRDAGVLGPLGDGFAVEVQSLVIAQSRAHELSTV